MKNEKTFIDLLAGGLIFVLATSSIVKAIINSLYLPIGYPKVFLITLLLFVLFSLYFYNGLTVLFGTSTAIFLIYIHIRLNSLLQLSDKAIKYIHWLTDCILGNTTPIHGHYINWSAWTITGIMAIIFYFIIIKFDMPTLYIALAGTLLGVLWFLGHTSIYTYIWIYALVSICLISAQHRRFLSRKYTMPRYGIWQLSILPLAFIIILVSASMVPSDTESFKSEYMIDQIQQLEDKLSGRAKPQKPRTPFRLTQTGFQGSSDDLGGPIELKDGLLLKVKSPQPVYLRGSILNNYTGNGWKNSKPSMKYRLNNLLNTKNRDQILDLDENLWTELSKLENTNLISKFTVDIELIDIKTSTLFAPIRTVNVKPHIRSGFVPYINDKGELFTDDNEAHIKGYTLDIIHLDLSHRDALYILDNYILNIDFRDYIPSSYSQYQKALEIQRYYSNINSDIPQRVLNLAKDITRKSKSSLGKALDLKEYLVSNYNYTLTPPYTPEDRDFVDYFLFDLEEGYCTYFASAFAIMGRAVGLPTRYIEGFSMPPHPRYSDVYEVQKSNSHAWVEVYFPGIGWIPFDPTPATHLDIIDTNQDVSDEYIDLDRPIYDDLDFDQELDIMDSELPDYEDHGKQFFLDRKVKTIIIYTLIICLSLSTLFIVISIFLYRQSVSKLPILEQIEVYYSKILGLLDLYNFPIKSGETPYAYALRVDEWHIDDVGTMTDIATLVVKSKFSNYSPNKEDIDTIHYFYDNLKADLIGVIGFHRYIILKIQEISDYLLTTK